MSLPGHPYQPSCGAIAYREFKKKFGEDGNLLVIGVETKDFFSERFFNQYENLYLNLKKSTVSTM